MINKQRREQMALIMTQAKEAHGINNFSREILRRVSEERAEEGAEWLQQDRRYSNVNRFFWRINPHHLSIIRSNLQI